MVANETWCFWLEQRSLIKFFKNEKFKPYKIYRRMFDMYREAGFSFKIFTSGLNMDLLLRAWVEKVLGAAVSKEGHADSILWHENSYWFLWKRCASYCQFFRGKFTIFIEWPLYIIQLNFLLQEERVKLTSILLSLIFWYFHLSCCIGKPYKKAFSIIWRLVFFIIIIFFLLDLVKFLSYLW